MFVFAIHLSLDIIDIRNFCGDLFSRKYQPCEYRKNKWLTKLNSFTVVDENFNSFEDEAWELATFEVLRYPMNDIII